MVPDFGKVPKQFSLLIGVFLYRELKRIVKDGVS